MKKVTPLNQCLALLQTDMQKHILIQTIDPLNNQMREDFLLAVVAFIRFGVKRPFSNQTMAVLFESYCDLLDN